jgi:hypothetical protein
MVLERPAFVPTKLEEERAQEKSTVISLRLNQEEIQRVEDAGRLLQQEMPSSIVKQLMELGLVCLQEPETRLALRTATENVRRNVRRGVEVAEPKIKRL